jgi:glycopeptide antibiotics resistance protein
MILTPSGTGATIEAVPLVGLFEQVRDGTAVEQIGGNLLVFAAFGYCARLRWRLRIATIIGVAAAASLGVEILQYALDIGRVSSVDDVLLNALGAGLAATLAALVQLAGRRRRASPTGPEAQSGAGSSMRS